MSNVDYQNSGSEAFEESLRQILSYAPADAAGRPQKPNQPSQAPGAATKRVQAIAAKVEAEKKTLFWFKLLRPVALLSLIGLMALFVLRIINFHG